MSYLLCDSVYKIEVVGLTVGLVITNDAIETFITYMTVKIVTVRIDQKCGALNILAVPVSKNELMVEIEEETKTLWGILFDCPLIFGVAHVDGSKESLIAHLLDFIYKIITTSSSNKGPVKNEFILLDSPPSNHLIADELRLPVEHITIDNLKYGTCSSQPVSQHPKSHPKSPTVRIDELLSRIQSSVPGMYLTTQHRFTRERIENIKKVYQHGSCGKNSFGQTIIVDRIGNIKIQNLTKVLDEE